MWGKGVEVKDLERAGIWARGLWRGGVVHGGVYDRGRAESDGGTDSVVTGAVAERTRMRGRAGRDQSEYLKRRQSSLTAPIKLSDEATDMAAVSWTSWTVSTGTAGVTYTATAYLAHPVSAVTAEDRKPYQMT